MHGEQLKADIEIDCKDSEIVLKSIKPDMEETRKFSVSLKAGKGKVLLSVSSETIAGLMAGVSNYLKLIRAAAETVERI